MVPVGGRLGDDPASLDGFTLTEVGNARRFVARHGERVRFCHARRRWLIWNGQCWAWDEAGRAVALMKDAVAGAGVRASLTMVDEHQAARTGTAPSKDTVARAGALGKWSLKSQTARILESSLRMAESEPGIPVGIDMLDQGEYLLNAGNGTLDLATGRLRAHQQADLLTRVIDLDYNPRAACPLWEATLRKIFKQPGDPARTDELLRFVQRWAGYCLTGCMTEHAVLVLFGYGGNGKSLFVNVLSRVLGPYAGKAPERLLTQTRGERHPTELADLQGTRLLVASETERGHALNESRVKDLTGGEVVKARGMRQDFFQFKPQAKIILSSNYKPAIVGTDAGIWRRLRLVHLRQQFRDEKEAERDGVPFDPALAKDPHLEEKLVDELPGILTWAVRGCRDWIANGLGCPAVVAEATASYRAAEDLLGQFLQERCVRGDFRIKAGSLLSAYNQWLKGAGVEKPETNRGLCEALESRGFTRVVSNGVRWCGLDLKPEDDFPD